MYAVLVTEEEKAITSERPSSHVDRLKIKFRDTRLAYLYILDESTPLIQSVNARQKPILPPLTQSASAQFCDVVGGRGTPPVKSVIQEGADRETYQITHDSLRCDRHPSSRVYTSGNALVRWSRVIPWKVFP